MQVGDPIQFINTGFLFGPSIIYSPRPTANCWLSTEAHKVIQLGLSSITGILEHKLCLFEIELQSKKNCFWWFSQHFLKFFTWDSQSKTAKYYLYNEMISLITLKACFDTVSLLRQDFARYSHYHLTAEWSKAKLELRRLGLPKIEL